MSDYEPLPLPDDLPAEITDKINAMKPQEAAAWLAVHGDEARMIAARNAALARMTPRQIEIARAGGMTPEAYMAYWDKK